MKVLLHTCCAPCFICPYEDLTAEGHEVTAYSYNPNIHPLIEFRRRLKALKVLQERMGFPAVYEEDYGLVTYLKGVRWDGPERCADCYRMRLEGTAREAARRGADAISTTLLASKHQDREAVVEAGQRSAEAAGVDFLVQDWRDTSEESHERARAMRLYMQNYCGCIFSEWERFRDTARHLYRGPGGTLSKKGD